MVLLGRSFAPLLPTRRTLINILDDRINNLDPHQLPAFLGNTADHLNGLGTQRFEDVLREDAAGQQCGRPFFTLRDLRKERTRDAVDFIGD